MATDKDHLRILIDKLDALPPEEIAEVEDFVDFLRERTRDGTLSHAAAKVAERSFAEVWENPDDAVYDEL